MFVGRDSIQNTELGFGFIQRHRFMTVPVLRQDILYNVSIAKTKYSKWHLLLE